MHEQMDRVLRRCEPLAEDELVEWIEDEALRPPAQRQSHNTRAEAIRHLTFRIYLSVRHV